MNVSLDQAIEIHARALKHKKGFQASLVARDRALDCASTGDDDGHEVWLKVAVAAEMLLAEDLKREG